MRNPMLKKALDSIMSATGSALKTKRAGLAKPKDAITGEETTRDLSRPLEDGSRPDEEEKLKSGPVEAPDEEEKSDSLELSDAEMEMLRKFRAGR